MKLKVTAVVCAVTMLGAAAATPVFAGQLDWNFYQLTGMPAAPGSATWNTSSSSQPTASPFATFTQAGEFLNVYSGVSCTTNSMQDFCDGSGDLYSKNGGSAAEQGLGLTNDPYNNNEIANPNAIGVYTSQLSFGSVELGSVQSGETWQIWGSNGTQAQSGLPWTLLDSGTGGGVINYTVVGHYNWISIYDPTLTNTSGGNSNNILLSDVTTVPEPGTLALFGAGLLGCALIISRRRNARQS